MILKTLTGLVLVTPHLRLIRDQVPKNRRLKLRDVLIFRVVLLLVTWFSFLSNQGFEPRIPLVSSEVFDFS